MFLWLVLYLKVFKQSYFGLSLCLCSRWCGNLGKISLDLCSIMSALIWPQPASAAPGWKGLLILSHILLAGAELGEPGNSHSHFTKAWGYKNIKVLSLGLEEKIKYIIYPELWICFRGTRPKIDTFLSYFLLSCLHFDWIKAIFVCFVLFALFCFVSAGLDIT